MDKASAYEAGDCGFESRRGLLFSCFRVFDFALDDPTGSVRSFWDETVLVGLSGRCVVCVLAFVCTVYCGVWR